MYPSVREYTVFPSYEIRNNWLSLFDYYNLTVAFENHDHAFKRTKIMKDGLPNEQGTLYTGDGSWGVPPRPGSVIPEDKTWYLDKIAGKNYVLHVEVEENIVNITAIDNNGNVFDNIIKNSTWTVY